MLQATGNLWDAPESAVIVITTNGVTKQNGACVMGRGCAQEARDAYPGIDKKLGHYITVHGNRPLNLGLWTNQRGTRRIVSFPTKHRWNQNSDLQLIKDSALLLRAMANKFGWQEIHMPRPGCGNGGLDWADVAPVLETILDDRFTVITHKE